MTQPVYLNYNQAQLDAHYNNRDKVDDFPGYVESWERYCQQALDAFEVRRDVAYGNHSMEKLDIFMPGNNANGKVQLFIHGGYWKSLTKNEFSFVANGFCAQGITTIVIDYELIPKVTMSQLVSQCQRALAWVWLNANEFGANADEIYISGHSAGGHLVGMLMGTQWQNIDSHLPPAIIKGACSLSGLLDLHPIQLCYLNDDLHLSDEDVRVNSPVHLSKTQHSELLLLVGGKEGPEYERQSASLVQAWQGDNSVTRHVSVAGHDHFSIVTTLNDAQDPVTQMIHQQMKPIS